MFGKRMSRWTIAVVAIGAAAFWAVPSDASVSITLSTSPTGATTIASNPATVQPGPVGVTASTTAPVTQDGITVNSASSTQSYQPPTNPIEAESQSTVINLSNSGTATQTFTITVASDFANSPLVLSFPGGGTATSSLESSHMDPNTSMSLEATISPTTGPGGVTTLNGMSLSGPIPPTATVNAPTTGLQITAPGFTITQTATITMAANTTMQFIATTTVTPVPEPGSMAMSLLALPLLGLGYRMFRRRGE